MMDNQQSNETGKVEADVPTQMEREEDLRWLKMLGGEKADKFALDFFAIACKIGKKYIAALEHVEGINHRLLTYPDKGLVEQVEQLKAERDALCAANAQRLKEAEGALTEIAAAWQSRHDEAWTKWEGSGTEAFEDLDWVEASAIKRLVETARKALSPPPTCPLHAPQTPVKGCRACDEDVAKAKSSSGVKPDELESFGRR